MLLCAVTACVFISLICPCVCVQMIVGIQRGKKRELDHPGLNLQVVVSSPTGMLGVEPRSAARESDSTAVPSL